MHTDLMSVVILEKWLNWGGFLFLAFQYCIICFYMVAVKESSVKKNGGNILQAKYHIRG